MGDGQTLRQSLVSFVLHLGAQQKNVLVPKGQHDDDSVCLALFGGDSTLKSLDPDLRAAAPCGNLYCMKYSIVRSKYCPS
jgi:hypothetical protein